MATVLGKRSLISLFLPHVRDGETDTYIVHDSHIDNYNKKVKKRRNGRYQWSRKECCVVRWRGFGIICLTLVHTRGYPRGVCCERLSKNVWPVQLQRTVQVYYQLSYPRVKEVSTKLCINQCPKCTDEITCTHFMDYLSPSANMIINTLTVCTHFRYVVFKN